MQSLTTLLASEPLDDGQRVLALTFMHGSRRRLEERLGQQRALRGRFECSTIDGFAWRLVGRWRSLATALGYGGITVQQYERICEVAAVLMQRDEVQGWVAAAFPVLLVDEAQDLTATRLGLIQGLAVRLKVFVAADEFQCLDEALRPNPACAWLSQVSRAEELGDPKRTRVRELLDAATAIRSASPPKSGNLFKVQLTPKPQLAGAWVSSNLSWYGGGKSVAVITPALGAFARDALAWAAANRTARGTGPHRVEWEESEAKLASRFIADLALQAVNDVALVTQLLSDAGNPRVARDVMEWMDVQRRARSKTTFTKEEVAKEIEQSYARRRRVGRSDLRAWRGMTVHGAKNREFDNVIVIWPAAITGTDDQKRRLLYNAVTRARERCLILVQSKAAISVAPFA